MNFPFWSSVTGRFVAVVDPLSRDLIAAEKPDAKVPIASIQKLLTALLVIERGDLDHGVEIEPEDTFCRTARAELIAGAVHSRRELLACLLVGSANDAALALARDHSGSAAAFALSMNERALSLGMTSSHFHNPTGLPHEGQFSSAIDAARLAVAADALPILRELVTVREYSLLRPGAEASVIRNTNRLLGTLGICDGMKTGFTRAAGYCLVATGGSGERRRIVVILNSSAEGIWSDAQSLLTWATTAAIDSRLRRAPA